MASLVLAPIRWSLSAVAIACALILWPILAVHSAIARDILADDDRGS
jgi:hypothetical protein